MWLFVQLQAKFIPLIILREIRMTREKRHWPQKTSRAASQGGPVGFRKAGKKKTRNMWLSLLMRFSTRLRKLNQKYELEKFLDPNHLRNTCYKQWRVSDAIEAKNAKVEGKRMRSMKKQEKAIFGWPPASSEHFWKISKLRKQSLHFKISGDVVSKLIWRAHEQEIAKSAD